MTVNVIRGPARPGPIELVTLELTVDEARALTAVAYLLISGPEHTVNGNRVGDYKDEMTQLYQTLGAIECL